ncbi:hypothetical protein EDC39_107132 [Geothermobacter ehrlichii]|uniref:Uncharacterized protein n=1 Tax=Geothermobacter ehrlichii TaxID=213224 RepID=A0A5D3WJ97_9BACT|nr:hypothetical protein [Geothermobacter ehrlichii]TYO98331.1 hypothetical protein EDC39_107132 [Geothermobacter ehrlichii]
MRYIYYTALILILATLGVWLTDRMLAPRPRSEAVVKVNGRIITRAEFDLRRRYAPYAFKDEASFVDNLVTRELLIQEARRRGIDREDAFRVAMEDHYEQALIHQLLERKRKEIAVSVDRRQIERFRDCAQYRYRLTRIIEPATPAGGNEQVVEEDFLDLPPNWQLQLLDLRPGESSTPFPTNEGLCHLMVESIRSAARPPSGLDDESIRRQLEEAARQARLDSWVEQLRRKADIEISLSTGDGRREG